MPKRKRHQPGQYKPKPEPIPNFTGPKPLTLFRGPDGLWGAKDGAGQVVIEPVYHRAEQTETQKERNVVHLVSRDTVLAVSPDDWDLVAWISADAFERDD